VRFVLDRPNAGLPWLLSGVALSVTGEADRPTSRWSITSRTRDRLELAALGDGAGLPDVVLSWTDTPQDAYGALALGLVDAAVAPPEALDDAGARFGAVPPARSISRFYGINVTSPNLSDERLQQAVVQAVDARRVAAREMPSPVFAVDGVLAPTLAGYRRGGCGEVCAFDRERSESLVAEVKAEQGDDAAMLTVVYAGAEQARTAAAIAADLELAGIAVSVVEQSEQDLASTIAAGGADLFAFGWVAGAGSLDAVIPALFQSDSPANALRVGSGEVDRLIAEAAETERDEQRWDLLSEAHEIALRGRSVLPLAVAKSHLVTAPQAAQVKVRADGSLSFLAGQ
jgi:ABC-type transport system substrate-binding protein